jgi:anti-sigma factor RsiW
MRCGETEKWISDDLDGALSPRRKARLEAHLGSCPACREYRDGLARLQAAAGVPAERSPEYWAGFARRLEAKLDAIGSGKAAAAPVAVWRRWAWAAPAVLVLAAAGVWLALGRKGAGLTEAWIPSGEGIFPMIEAVEADPGLEQEVDLLVRSSLDDLVGSVDADAVVLSAADPLFWEGVSDDELRAIASELEKESGPGGPK